MTIRFSDAHVDTWRKEGAVVVPEFFNDKEIKDVTKDFEIIFPGRKAEDKALDKKKKGESDVHSGSISYFKAFKKHYFSPYIYYNKLNYARQEDYQ